MIRVKKSQLFNPELIKRQSYYFDDRLKDVARELGAYCFDLMDHSIEPHELGELHTLQFLITSPAEWNRFKSQLKELFQNSDQWPILKTLVENLEGGKSQSKEQQPAEQTIYTGLRGSTKS
jgi:hypothetical protein